MIRNALILAGGQGSRLDPLGNYLPKCLATVYNRPLIDTQLQLLHSAGVTQIFISVSARHQAVIAESLRCLQQGAENSLTGMRLQLLEEQRPARIAALFEAARRMPAEPFWLVLGDIYFGEQGWAPATLPEGASALLHTRRYADPTQLAAETSNVLVDGSRVVAMRDKPNPTEVQGEYGWDATALIGPDFVQRGDEILAWLRQNRPQAHVGDLFTAALGLGLELRAAPGSQGAWINVNTPEQLLAASQQASRQPRQQGR